MTSAYFFNQKLSGLMINGTYIDFCPGLYFSLLSFLAFLHNNNNDFSIHLFAS